MLENSEYTLALIKRIKESSDRIQPLVVINCTVFQHELYLRDALNGFVMQKTNFPFVAIVHDDASPDMSAKIVREYASKYPDIILPIIEKENQYSKGTLGLIMLEACKATGAKYIAMCEGDDYWTDPLKLQKQVDFLESHPDYGLCYTQVLRYDQQKKVFSKPWGGPNIRFREFLNENNAPTLTVVLRSNIYYQYFSEINPMNKHWLMGDYPLNLYISLVSKIKFVDDVTGVYRILPESASHSNSIDKLTPYLQSIYDIKKFFINNFDTGCEDYDLEFSLLCILMSFLSIANDNFRNLCLLQLDRCNLSKSKKLIYKLRIKNYLFNKLYGFCVSEVIKIKKVFHK